MGAARGEGPLIIPFPVHSAIQFMLKKMAKLRKKNGASVDTGKSKNHTHCTKKSQNYKLKISLWKWQNQ